MRRVGPTGLALIAAGLLVAATMGAAASYWHLLGALVLMGLGMALAAPPATAAIVGSLPEDKQGVASAVNDTAREVGGALGIAVLGSVLADHVGHLGPHTNPQELVDGFQAALHVGAAAFAIGALIVFARARRGILAQRSPLPDALSNRSAARPPPTIPDRRRRQPWSPNAESRMARGMACPDGAACVPNRQLRGA